MEPGGGGVFLIVSWGCKFTLSLAADVAGPYAFISVRALDVAKPYIFIRFLATGANESRHAANLKRAESGTTSTGFVEELLQNTFNSNPLR